MSRFALGIEYSGNAFSGWQRQPKLTTVQGSLEKALSKIANQPIEVFCAGRTDCGVHARAQVVHFDTETTRENRTWVFGTNTHLNADARVLWAKEVPQSFDARRSATSRRYRYWIYNHPIRPSLLRHYVGWYYGDLDVNRMQEAANHWIGEHDFSSFRGSGCQSKTPIRRIDSIHIERRGHSIILDFTGNAFLYHMIRNMVGVLLKIGYSKKPVEWAKTVLLACDRKKAGITASPAGLYLYSIEYPEHFQLPQPQNTFIEDLL